MNDSLLIGEVTEVINDNNNRFNDIIFRVPNVIEDCIAFSVSPQEEVSVGDEVLVIKLPNHLNTTFVYKRITQNSNYSIDTNGVRMRIENDQIFFEYGDHSKSEAEERAILGDKLVELLRELANILSASVTSSGPSLDPATQAKLTKWKMDLGKSLSNIMKLV